MKSSHRRFAAAFGLMISLALLTACSPVTPIPSTTPTGTNTVTPTATVTQTPTASPSPTILPTLPVPNLASATPLPDAESYHLVPRTPEKAEELIRLMENYPETLTEWGRGYHDYDYNAAFYYAVHAGREALLRYPEHPRAKNWRWWIGDDLLLSSQLSNRGKPSSYFADLVSDGLNSGEISIDELPGWISPKFPDASVSLMQLDSPRGFSSSHVLVIDALALWVLKTPKGFSVYPLMDNIYYHSSKVEKGDLTGDGVPEFFMYIWKDANFVGGIASIYVFDLSHVPFRQLSFGSGQKDAWDWIGWGGEIIHVGSEQAIHIRNSYVVGCPVYRDETYRWNGFYFELADVQFEFDLAKADELDSCVQMSPGNSYLSAGPDTMIALFEKLQPYWPTDFNYLVPEQYPKDEVRFRLGVLYAMNGERAKTVEYLTGLVEHPSDQKSTWIVLAKRFLEKYTSSTQLYRACVTVVQCDADFVLSKMVQKMSLVDFPSAIDILKAQGVPVLADSLFDFNGDNSPEHWFTVRHPNRSDIEFWLLVQTPEGLTARYLDSLKSSVPQIKLFSEAGSPALFQIGNEKMFTLQISVKGQPVVMEYALQRSESQDVLVRRSFEQLREQLYSGHEPVNIKNGLLALQENRDFNCNLSYDHARFSGFSYQNYCPDFYYLLGLAYELSGDDTNAVKTYWQLWHDFFENPYALMARFKLEEINP